MIIRPVRPEEFERVGDLVVDAYRPYFPDLGEYEAELRDVAGRSSRVEVLVAELDGRVVGTATYVPGPGRDSDFDEPDWADLRMLAVDPSARGKGIGRALSEACIERARRDGRAVIGLHTDNEMTPAHSLYTSLGFVRDAEHDWIGDGFELRAYRLNL